MANRTQLKLLTTGQENALRAIKANRQVAEIVRVYWPEPDGIINYCWWQADDDPAFSGIDAFLDGRPLVPAFIADDEVSRFHELPRSSAFGDDTVRMRWTNQGTDIEELLYIYQAGVKIEFFYYFSQINLAVSWWFGTLRAPEGADKDFIYVTADNGYESPDIIVPNWTHASECPSYFGGQLTAPELALHPICDYDKHLGGTRGLNNPATSAPFVDCPHTKAGCLARMGDLLSYGGDDTVRDATQIGGGQHKTTSTVEGNETRLKDPVWVPFGKFHLSNLKPLAYAKEINPSPNHQDKGTLRTLIEIGAGPVKSITNPMVLERTPQGLITRLGTQQQAATVFSPNVLNYNRRALVQININPIDPRPILASQIVGEADVEGQSQVKIYSDTTTFTEDYTQNRAWAFLKTLTDLNWGYRLDQARYNIQDFLWLAEKKTPFNGVLQGAPIQQVAYDFCMPALWNPPFFYNGKIRVMPMEEIDLTASDIPVFTDTGANRNILFASDEEGGLSRLKVRYTDPKKLPNSVTTLFYDEELDYIERPLTFQDWNAQIASGKAWGDNSKRKVEARYSAVGLTAQDDVAKLGVLLRDIGPFGHGGLLNNVEVEFVIDALSPEAINLHEGKVVKVVSDKLYIYVDQAGFQVQWFKVKKMDRNSQAELVVTAQQFVQPTSQGCPPVTWTNLVQATVLSDNSLKKTTGFNNCYTDASGTGDAGGWTLEQIAGGNWEVNFTLGPDPSGRSFVGLTDGSFSLDFTTWDYCIHVSTEANTSGTPHPANSIFVYEGAPPNKAFLDGVWNEGDNLKIKCSNGVITYWHKTTLIYTSSRTPNYPMRVIASLACLNKTVNNLVICDTGVSNGATTEMQVVTNSKFVIVDRIWRDQELTAGVPGFYVAAGPADQANTWPAFELWRDQGAGYTQIYETEDASLIGTAATVLASTTIGTETVDVDLLPGQVLVSFTGGEVTAGAGLVWLGGEIFQYQTATQQSTTPNRWRLSVLSNRGAKCTMAAKATHVIGEDFAFLDAANVLFVPLETAEIGVARNYKGFTAGQDITGITAVSHTFAAPNFKPTTPADYNLSFDAGRVEVLHDWMPISDPCLVSYGLVYEIYEDLSGAPGALLWSGSASEWREPVSGAGVRVYHFKAKNNYASGAYITAGVTITAGDDGGLFGQPLFGE